MARVVRAAPARLDIIAIVDYIAANNFSAAERWLDGLDESLIASPRVRTLARPLSIWRLVRAGILFKNT
jgi:hypothetical protein